MTTLHHCIIGLPRSGKTTFLAALWHLLNAGEVPTKLVLDKLIGDHQHLNTIVEAWRRCEEVPRTSIAAEVSVSIHVHELVTGHRAILTFPDLSGESFERQLATRCCPAAYIESFNGCGGIMLFVTADRPHDGMTILDLAPILNGFEESGRSLRGSEWGPQLVPEQVQLVELLQFLQQPPFEIRKRRVVVLVSAWDLMVGSQCAPAQWLARELPLLHQFLVTNSDSFESRIYGVSAQGGDVTGEQRKDLLRMTPSERICCIGPEPHTDDLTDPIVWLSEEY